MNKYQHVIFMSLVMALSGTTTLAVPLTIIGVDTSSGIKFEGATVSNYYTLEFATSVDGPWTNWGSITDQPVTGSVMTISSPLMYRIRQADSSAFPPYATTSHTHSNITSSMLATSAVQTANIANGSVTQAKLASASVGNSQIASGAITESKISASGNLVSSLNADLLDGLHAAQISASGSSIPSGGIIMWSGSIDNIPSGWVLCNGSNGTPDLRNRFIIGAGTLYSVGSVGGSTNHNHGGTTGSSGSMIVYVAGTTQHAAPANHSHSITADSSLPPFYALCYIMKQ